MRSFIVIVFQPDIHIGLKFFQTVINLFTECRGIELILHSPVEPFANTIGLGTLGFGLTVFYVFKSQIQLIFVMFPGTTLFCTPVGQNTQ